MSEVTKTEIKRPCPDKPCQRNRFRDQSPSLKFADDVNECLQGRPVLYAGVLWIGAMRRFFVPRTCTITMPASPKAAVVRKDAGQLTPAVAAGPFETPKPTTLSEPIVSVKSEEKSEEMPEVPSTALTEVAVHYQPLEVTLMSQIQDSYEQISKRAQSISQDVNAVRLQIVEATSEAIRNVVGPEESAYRYMAISSSGLGGYILGIPANVRTRAVYAATGVIAMATLCYPEEARHYNIEGVAFIRDSVEQGVGLMRSVYLNTTKEENSDRRNSSYSKEESEHDFSTNQEDNTPNKRIWRIPVFDIKRDDVGVNVDKAVHPPGLCPGPSDECKTIPCDHDASQLSHKSKNTVNEMSLDITSTDDSSSTSTGPDLKEVINNSYSYTQSIPKDNTLEDVEGDDQQPDESTNNFFELQNVQTLPNVVETTDVNVGSTKEEHDPLNLFRHPHHSFSHSFENQHMVDSSTEDYENLYSRRV